MSGALGAFKAALVARGVIAQPYTQAPLLPLTDAEARAVAERVAAAGPAPIRQRPGGVVRGADLRRGPDFLNATLRAVIQVTIDGPSGKPPRNAAENTPPPRSWRRITL